MRIKRSVTRIFSLMVLPAITVTVAGYFGFFAIWGSRGILAYEDVAAQAALRKSELVRLTENRKLLEHRIALMEKGDGPDPDLVEELARTQLMDGAPNQVAVSRGAR